MIITKALRFILGVKEQIYSGIRIYFLKLKYPSLKIEGSYIGKGCSVVVVDGSDVTLKNVYIHNGVNIKAEKGSSLFIKDSYIGYNSVIVSYNSIEIGEHCEIAEMVVIRDQDHDYSTGNLIKNSGYKSEAIKIGRNVWIGAKASILKGVIIGDNSVVGAHSLVNKSFPASSIIVGIPARKVDKK
jgi:acetyltransferase-like isoleucine patch superfamily enzyme